MPPCSSTFQKSFPLLRELDFNSNKISTLPSSLLTNLPQVDHLVLQIHFYLIIVTIPIMILSSAFQLESLVLDNNKLTTVVLEVADIFHRQHFPPIANPIVCSH